MFNLTGKTALVTGASGGIGGAIARALHAQGAKVAVSGTRHEVLDTLAAELGGGPVLPCDLSNKDSVEALIPDAEKALGQVDILVANAGITKDNLFVALKDEDWEQVLAVATDKRIEALPDVPTMAEAGYPDIVSETWNAISA